MIGTPTSSESAALSDNLRPTRMSNVQSSLDSQSYSL